MGICVPQLIERFSSLAVIFFPEKHIGVRERGGCVEGGEGGGGRGGCSNTTHLNF
jgi:hypothetical protein